MAFKVLMFSPLHNIGLTTVTAMIAHTFAYKGFTSMIGYTDVYNAIPRYFGVTDLDDPTRSITQVIRMVDSNSINSKDILKYAYQYDIKHKAYFMNFGDSRLNDTAQHRILDYVFTNVPTDLTILDMSEAPDNGFAQEMIQKATSIFIVTDLSDKGLMIAKNWMESDLFPSLDDVYIILNHYEDVVIPWKRMADKLNVLPSHVCKLHHNPFITQASLNNALHTLVPLIEAHEPKVANLNNDLKEINQAINDYALQKRNHINFQDALAKLQRKTHIGI